MAEEATQPTTYYIVRHGQAEHNAGIEKDGTVLLAGHRDFPLTEKGEEQARTLGRRFIAQGVYFHYGVSSDLERASVTAHLIDPNLPIHTARGLRERYFGRLEEEQMTSTQFLPKVEALRETINNLPPEELSRFRLAEGMENDEEVAGAMQKELQKLAQTHTGEQILVVSHSNKLRTWLVSIGAGTRRELRSGTCKNTSFVKVTTVDGNTFIVESMEGIEKAPDEPEADNFTSLVGFSIRS